MGVPPAKDRPPLRTVAATLSTHGSAQDHLFGGKIRDLAAAALHQHAQTEHDQGEKRAVHAWVSVWGVEKNREASYHEVSWECNVMIFEKKIQFIWSTE